MAPPSVTITEAAVEMLRETARPAGQVFRLRIRTGRRGTATFTEYDLGVGAPEPGDVVLETPAGPLHLDAESGALADGVRVHFIHHPVRALEISRE